ncbi:hypothetical protein FUAX_53690 (plasmid) [Fulvitalea axinellae]|uniref:Outer membrane protein TolC n=1 Tax=Fulvitalea axinellae TaxID=1182444 RepID=A0AAU9D6C9_9BACT|nr:hypothetical protein FUAX_53690 [Fulvitalea axinellae]
MKRLILFLIAGLAFSAGAKAQDAESFLSEAARNSPELKAVYARFEASMQRITQAKAWDDPKLSFGYFISPIETRVGAQQAKLSLSQTFPWFGTYALKEKVAAEQAEADFQRFIQARNQLFFEVRSKYYELQEWKAKGEWIREQIAVLERYKSLITAKYSGAEGKLVDVLRVDLRLENRQTELEVLKAQWPSLRNGFNRLLNREGDPEIELPEVLAEIPEGVLSNDTLSFKHNPMLGETAHMKNRAETEERLAKKQGMPKFGVGMDYAFIDKREGMPDLKDNGKNAFMPMVTLSLPIFRKKYKAMQIEAEKKREYWEYRNESISNSLSTELSEAQYGMVRAEEQNALYQNQIGQLGRMLRLQLADYSATGKDFVEVLRLQEKELAYRIMTEEAKRNYWTAKAKMDLVRGTDSKDYKDEKRK